MVEPRFRAVSVSSGATQESRKGDAEWYVLDRCYGFRPVAMFAGCGDNPAHAAALDAAARNEAHDDWLTGLCDPKERIV